MRFFNIIIILSLAMQTSVAQTTVALALQKNLPCKGRVTVSMNFPNSKFPKLIKLPNDDSVRLSETGRLELVYRPEDTVRLLIASGITTKNQLFAVADENYDGSLDNDPVHYIQPNENKFEFACNLPLICISGLPLVSPNSNDTLCLRIAPIKAGLKDFWFSNFFDVAFNTEKIRTAMIDDYYLSGFYEYKGAEYEIRAILHPASYNLYNTPATLKVPTRHMVFFGVLPKGGRQGSVLTEHMLPKIDKLQGEAAPFFKTGNHYLRFDTIDLPNNRVVITIRDTPPPTVAAPLNIADATAQHIGTTMQQDLFLPGRPAILHFSGSWCKPCQMALPDFKKLYKKYKGKYQFSTILAEKNLATAKLAYKKEQLLWPGFYEKLSCKEPACLQQRLGVSIFPTYAIISSNGEVLQQVNSVEELEEALKKMDK